MSEDSRALLLVGRLLLPVAIALAVLSAWTNNPQADGFYSLGKANALLADGRYSPAMLMLENTLKSFQGPQIRLSLSYAYLARRDEVRAERQMRIALPAAPAPLRPSVLAQLGRVLVFAGREDEALGYFRKAQAEAVSFPGVASAIEASRSAQWHIAMIYWRRGDWDAARPGFEVLGTGSDVYAVGARVRLAELAGPTDNTASILLSNEVRQLLLHPGGDSAIPDLRVPGLSEGISRAAVEEILSTLDNARLQIDNSRPLRPEAIDTLWGGAFLAMGENLLARRYFEQALAAEPDYGPAHARLALALFALGDTADALSHVNRALALNPNDPLPRHVLARIFTVGGDWANAEMQLEALNKLQPQGIETHLEWANFYRLQGEYDKAEDAYIDAVNAQIAASALPPGLALDGVTEDTNAGVALARFYTDVRGLGCIKGLPAARNALILRPKDPASFDAVGWSLVICNQGADALPSLLEAIRRSPDEPRYHYHLAKAYLGLGRNAAAREQYNITMDLDPTGSWEHLALTDLVNMPK